MSGFGYLRDPVFLVAGLAYAVNRFWLKHALGLPFLHSHFDDLLLLPAALPPVLWLHRRLGWRSHDRPPGGLEVFGHWVIWSLICEAIGPYVLNRGTADLWDVVAYATGAVLAWLWWNRCPDLFPVPARGL